MPIKRIVVLANSVKHHPCRCIAGREIVLAQGGTKIGPWIRPISQINEGEIPLQLSRIANGRQPRVLDVIDVPLLGHRQEPGQPENWLLDETAQWLFVHTMALSAAAAWVETPRALWPGGVSSKNDRISSDELSASPSQPSLYLIRPRNLRFKGWTEDFNGKKKEKKRALFEYAGVHYDLGITDPVMTDKYFRSMPPLGKPPNEMRLSCGDRCLLCVSLAPPFNGYHYKVVATVLETV